MEDKIIWERDLELVLSRAKRDKRPVLLFFHNPL
jgi:hypothetical protein